MGNTNEDSDSTQACGKQSTTSIVWGTESLSVNLSVKEFLLTGIRDTDWALQALAYKFFDNTKESFFADLLSSARDLVSSSRQKQLSILKSILTIQSFMRMRSLRKTYLHLRKAIVRIQRRFKVVRVGSTLVYLSCEKSQTGDAWNCTVPENYEAILCD